MTVPLQLLPLLPSLSTQSLPCPLPPPPSPSSWHKDIGLAQCVGAGELNNLLDSYITKEAKFKEVIESHTERVSSRFIVKWEVWGIVFNRKILFSGYLFSKLKWYTCTYTEQNCHLLTNLYVCMLLIW